MRHEKHELYKGSTLALLCEFQSLDGKMSLVRRHAESLRKLPDLTPSEKDYLAAMDQDLADYNAEFE